MSARRLSRGTHVLGLALVLVAATTIRAVAAPGDLDLTFDGDGKAITSLSADTDWAYAVAIQGDGKIVAAGIASYDSDFDDPDFGLARYNRDGSLDVTFDGDGRVRTDFGFGSSHDGAYAVAIQSDGKIVAAGFSYPDFALARYNPDGSLDTTFDGDGKVTTDFSSDSDEALDVAVQEDGKIVAAGYSVFPRPSPFRSQYDFALARYNPDGSLDSTFDGDGKLTTSFTTDPGFDDDFARGVAVQLDGKIVAAGNATLRLGPSRVSIEFALARYHPDGSLDTTFDGDGKLTTDFSTEIDDNTGDFAEAVAIQPDGKIVAVGFTLVDREMGGIGGSVERLAMARYNPDGSLDVGLAHDGTVTGDVALGRGVALQRDGKIVVVGGGGFAVARYTPEGFLDPTFGGGDGWIATGFAGVGGFVEAHAVAIQGDGRIVVAGAGGVDFGVARYTVCRRTSSRGSSIPCR